MIVCTQCGFSNEDSDAFCGDCGEFLEFVGQKVEAEAPEEPAADLDLVAEEAAAEEPVGAMVEVDEAPVAANSVPAAAAADAPPTPAPSPELPAAPPPPAAEPEVVPATPSLRDRPAPAPATTAGGTTPAPAASAAPPEAPPKPAAPAPAPTTPAPAEPKAATPPPSTPAPAKPSTPGPSAPTATPPPKPAARPQAAAAEPAKPQPGDKVCAECGAGNTPQRKFCRSCGTSLVAAAPPPVVEEKPAPKLIEKVSDKVTGKKELGPMAAGERPPPKKSKSNLTKPLVIGAVVVLGAAALLFRGALTDKASDIRQTVVPGGFDPVNPNAAEATSEVPGHEALAATDKGSNTFWAEAAEGDGTGQAITIRFPAAFSLAKVGIFPGRSGAEFLAQPRPRDVHIEVLDGAGASLGGRDATLEDKEDLQLVDVSGDGVSAVRIEIRSVYPGQSGQEASITDLQFFTAS